MTTFASGITVPICAHCGRPISGLPTYIGGIPYHYGCTVSPYANLTYTHPAPSKDVNDALEKAAKIVEDYDCLDLDEWTDKYGEIGLLKAIRALIKDK